MGIHSALVPGRDVGKLGLLQVDHGEVQVIALMACIAHWSCCHFSILFSSFLGLQPDGSRTLQASGVGCPQLHGNQGFLKCLCLFGGNADSLGTHLSFSLRGQVAVSPRILAGPATQMLSSWCKMGGGKWGGVGSRNEIAGLRRSDSNRLWGLPAVFPGSTVRWESPQPLGATLHPWAGSTQAGKCLTGCSAQTEPCPQSSSGQPPPTAAPPGQPHIGAAARTAPTGTAHVTPRGLWLLHELAPRAWGVGDAAHPEGTRSPSTPSAPLALLLLLPAG